MIAMKPWKLNHLTYL